MSESSTAAASSPSTPYISDDYVFYEKSDVVLILSTRDTPLELDSLKYKATTTLIYSEYVVISSPILSVPGRNLGIFCSRLELKSGEANIDVSGKPGKTLCTTVSEGTGIDGADGGDGGEVWIYVGEMTHELMRSLKITANGGDGDQGSCTTDKGPPDPPRTGGRGGNGGNGGKINVFYDSTAFSLLGVISGLKVWTWPGQILRAQRILVPGCENLKKSGFPPDLLQKFTHTLSTYQTYAKSISTLSSALRTLVARPNDTQKHQPQEQTIVTARDCLGAIEALLKSTDAPQKPLPADIAKLETLAAEIGQWLGGGTDPEEDSICNAMGWLSGAMNTTSPRSNLSGCVEMVVENIKAIDYAMQNIMKSKTSSICGGKGGIGGYGACASTIPGPRGTDGNGGQRIFQRLVFDGRADDTKASQVYAFPDQCQMLLNKADRLFFNNSQEDRKSAATLYIRLTKRLAFVHTLLDPQQSVATSPLAQAYARVESDLHLTVSAMMQLESIYNHAQCRLNKICLGQDMFCSSPEWSPRLSYTFYKVRINSLLASLRPVEDATSQFKDPLHPLRSTSDTIQVCIQSNKETKAHTDNRIALLNNSKGILQTSATKINAYTRIIEEKRATIRSKIHVIPYDTHWGLAADSQSLIDAFSTLAIAPYEPAVGTGMVDSAHKPWKTIQSSYGTPINKQHILPHLGSYAGTLQSFYAEYTACQSTQIGAADTDRLMMLMTTTNFTKQLLDYYKEAIPEGDTEGLLQLLGDYMSAVNIRNQVVIAFNATLQMLQEAMTDSKYYGDQDRYLSKNVTKLDPNLPSIYLWLKKIENDLRMDTMQLLEHGGRAIRFWSLHPPPDFNQPGPLRSYPDLSENQKVLERRFEDYLIDRASSAWNTWPVQEDRRGRTYRFSDEEILTLRKPYLEGNGNKCYSVLLRFTPDTPPFIGMSNIRLRQVRVWLLGAGATPDVAYRYYPLAVEITHLGRESFQSEDGMIHKFDHDPVSIRFEYDTLNVTNIAHCNSGIVLCSNSLEQNETSLGGNLAAPIGPFGVWKIRIKETENPGVDLGNLTAGFMEFLGRSTTFRDV